MKLTNTQKGNRKSGMTLLELTVVILVLLSLITVLFIGARAWKKGSDRAANILNIRNVQQAVRGHANVQTLAIGAPLDSGVIVGPGRYLNTPAGPNVDITYDYDATVPVIGNLYLNGIYAGTSAPDFEPLPALYVEW